MQVSEPLPNNKLRSNTNSSTKTERKAEMSKYKKMYKATIGELSKYEARIAECSDMVQTLQAENQRCLDENCSLVEQLTKARIEADSKAVRLTGECNGCVYKGVNFQKCGSCTRNPKAIDKYRTEKST